MSRKIRASLGILCGLLGLGSASAQVLLGTINVGHGPSAVGVNPVTNRVYVTNAINETDTVSVIDATTDTVIATVRVGSDPIGVAVNPVTNKIYIANGGDDLRVTEIDGQTNMTTSIPVGLNPRDIAVDVSRNKVYVVNGSTNNVTVIDGATRGTRTVPVGQAPYRLAINPLTNKIYVTNYADSTLTVIDGATLQTTTVSGMQNPTEIALNSVTNKIYVANLDPIRGLVVVDGTTLTTTQLPLQWQPEAVAVDADTNEVFVGDGGLLTIIDGATLATVDVPVSGTPTAIAVDATRYKIYGSSTDNNTLVTVDGRTHLSVTIPTGQDPISLAVHEPLNKVYVANQNSDTVTVIGNATSGQSQFVPVTPCRLVDTRQGAPIQGGTVQNFNLLQAGGCNIPGSATAYSLNVTAVPRGPLGYLTIWPTGQVQPNVSTLNSPDGRVKANSAIVPGGYQGEVSVYGSDTTDLILDIDGYFTAPAAQTLQFYPLTPCRLVDTRGGQDGGTLQAGIERDYPVSGKCAIADSAAAYSFNVTAIPSSAGLDYLTVWPQGEPRPTVSTLNDSTGTIVANAAIVPAGDNQTVAFYAHNNNTDLLVDVNGYFAAAGSGYSLYSIAPCRAYDSRDNNGQPFSGERTINIAASPCAPPSNAAAYVFNATVVPSPTLEYLTLWPDGEQRPVVSTLNALDGYVTSNMAIVPSTNGEIDAYASGTTQLILDISSYFAP